ncbi:MAG: two-component sensor histidine kinase [Deltaproteobacteria bacterium]|nr:two-component sensor histidine kinase [Deltaproteobacteria bacterium]
MAEAAHGSQTRYWILLIIGATVTPLLLVSVVILHQFYEAHQERATTHLEELVAKHKQNIDGFLGARLGDIRMLASNFSFEELSQEEFLQERLNALQQVYEPVFVDLGVIDESGTQVAYAGPFRLDRVDYGDASWFQKAMQRDYFISDVFPGLRGFPHFIIAVRSNWKGNPWILRATLDLVAFNDLVEDLRNSQTGSAFILNRAGEFQIKPPDDFMPDREFLDELLGADLGDQHGIRVTQRRDQTGRDNIYLATALKGGSWRLVYQQAANEAFAEFHKARNVTLLAVFLGGLASVAVAFFLGRKTVSAIAEAEHRTQMISQQMVETGKLASVGELAAGIAHEINNPVAIMVEEAGWIGDILEDDDWGTPENLQEFRRALQQIKTQGSRCKQITHKLLSFARKTDERTQEVDPYALVEETVAVSAQRAKYANVEINTVLQPGLPKICASLSELQQVLLNLINNALDAMAKTGGTLEIAVKQLGSDLWIHVSDSGPGIPEANLERIFDPFFTTKPVGKGTGLGLSICYGIVTRMGGEIEASSVIGSGTEFQGRSLTARAGELQWR